MKSIKFFVVSIIIALLSSSFSAQAQEQIPAKDKNAKIFLLRKNTHTRNLEDLPEAYIDHNILTLSFNDSGAYNLYVQDENGEVVYQSVLPANGLPYTYDLSAVIDEEHFYTLIIEGPSGTYEGCF